jgi:hypothetical protein
MIVFVHFGTKTIVYGVNNQLNTLQDKSAWKCKWLFSITDVGRTGDFA